MSLLYALLYDNTPRPLPPSSAIRFHTTANQGDDDAVDAPNIRRCGACHVKKTEVEMFVKKDGTRGAWCIKCHTKQSEQRSRK